MNYLQIYKDEICNGLGVGVSIFVSGCPIHCDGCFNSEAWDFNSGKPFTSDTFNSIIEFAEKDYITRLSILGGEPFSTQNVCVVCYLVLKFRNIYPDKNIWVYSGYTFEELLKRDDCNVNAILANINYLIDGKYDNDKKDLSLKFRGSSNQRILDAIKSYNKKQAILADI